MRALALAAAVLAVASPAWAEERVVALVPFGHVSAAHLDAVEKALTSRMNVTVRREPERPLPQAAWYAPRKRWRAEKLLAALDAEKPEGAWKTVAVTAAEISTTKGEVVDWRIAGLGNLGGSSCVLSTWIYQQHSATSAQLLRRLDDLAVHEFGHTLGLEHCETEGCAMRDAKGKALTSADTSTHEYCGTCRARLPVDLLKR